MSSQIFPRSWTTLDASAWGRNLHAVASLAGNRLDRVIPVVKADAYGHGFSLLPMDLLHQTHGIGVALPAEALLARKESFAGRIYVLSSSFPEEVPAIIQAAAIPLVSCVAELRLWENAAESLAVKVAINLELDTGMGRSGALPGADSELVQAWKKCRHLKLGAISSHFSSADEDFLKTEEQSAQFQQRVGDLTAAGLRPEFLHLANSAGAVVQPQAAPRIIRSGIALCGWAPVAAFQEQLVPVLSWYARVLLVRELPAGAPVSYGGTFRCSEPTRVASVGLGYADGFPRSLSGKGASVLIAGQRCPLLGRVTMDQIMVDVTDLPPDAVRPGSQVTVLGRDGDQSISVAELADLAGTIPYEIFTQIGPRVARVGQSA